MTNATAQATQSISVILADDHALLRTGFKDTMGACEDIEVVYDTDNPADACQAFERLRPDVLVLDILYLEAMTGLDAAKDLIKHHPQARIVVLSQYDQPRLIKEAYQAGAMAFIPKNEDEALVEAIKKAARGEKTFIASVAQKLAALTAEQPEDPRDVLSEREFEIYKLIAQDRSNVEIAQELGLSQKAVSNALYSLREKLGIRRDTEITKHALRHGVIQLED